MYYPEHVIEQVREQSDIVGIISEYTALTQKGHSYFGLCPFHNEKTPSFSVSDDKQMYYCFGCGAGGNVITFLMQKENMSFPEALVYLAERAHIELEGREVSGEKTAEQHKKEVFLEMYKKAAKYYYYALMHSNYQHSLDYFVDRGMSMETIKKFGLGYAPPIYNGLYKQLHEEGYSEDLLVESGLCLKSEKKGVLYDRFSDRVMFPIFNMNKKVVAFGGRILGEGTPKYLNSAESLLFDKSRTLYGLHLARANKHPYYILVEGYMDVIAMHQAGFTQTVASLGTAFTSGHARLLKRYTNQVVILYDSDMAGKNATLRAIPILKAEKINVKVLQLQDGKDPDEFLKKHGKEKMTQLLEASLSDTWFKINDLEGQYAIDMPEQKIQFLKEVANIIASLESSIEQSIYTKEVASQYGIEQLALEAEIKKQYNMKLTVATSKPKVTREVSKLGVTNTQLVFLSSIYHYAFVYPYIKEYIDYTLFDEGLMRELAKHVLDALEAGKPVDIQYFNSRYADIKEQQQISTVFMNKDTRYEDADALRKMLTETIKSLNMKQIEYQLKNIGDVREVQKLLEKKKVLDKLYIEFING
ncbi:MAG: DNA primase [Cellulosilyticaceae bacterium]